MTDIFIFLDTYWEYERVVDYVNYVVQHLNIQPFGSSVTLLAARDGSLMVNRTFYTTDYYANWTWSSHSAVRPGFSLPIILSQTQVLAETIMKEERQGMSLGGRSMIALLVPSPTAFIYDYDYEYCKNYLNYFNRSLPGLNFLYFAGGAVIRFEDFVGQAKEDLFLLSYDVAVKTAAEPVVKRIRQVHRRLSNPRCSAYGSSLGQGSNQIVQYAGLGHINFYRLPPQHFFGEGSMRFLKVKPLSKVAFIVCTSRTNPWPYRPPAAPYTPGVDCKQITTLDFSFDLGDLCANHDHVGACPALYVSVQAQSFAEANQLDCKEAACSSPAEARYAIAVNNLQCANTATGQNFTQIKYLLAICLALSFLIIIKK